MDQPAADPPVKNDRSRGAQGTGAVAQSRADALRLSLPDVPPLPEFAAPR